MGNVFFAPHLRNALYNNELTKKHIINNNLLNHEVKMRDIEELESSIKYYKTAIKKTDKYIIK